MGLLGVGGGGRWEAGMGRGSAILEGDRQDASDSDGTCEVAVD